MLHAAIWFGLVVSAVLLARRAGRSSWRWGLSVAVLPALILLVFQYSRNGHVVVARRQWCIRAVIVLGVFVTAIFIGDASASWQWLAQWYAKGLKLLNSDTPLFLDGAMLSSPTRNYQIHSMPALIMTCTAFGFLHGILMLRRPVFWAVSLTGLGFLIGVMSDFLLTWHNFLAIESRSAIYPLKAAVSLSLFVQVAISLVLAMTALRDSPAKVQATHP